MFWTLAILQGLVFLAFAATLICTLAINKPKSVAAALFCVLAANKPTSITANLGPVFMSESKEDAFHRVWCWMIVLFFLWVACILLMLYVAPVQVLTSVFALG